MEATMTTWIQQINRHYERTMYTSVDTKFYQGSDYHNAGYWPEGTSNTKEAGENLVDKLLSMVPNGGSTILDVACGKGATTRFLSRRLAHAWISGINISMKQLNSAKTNAPGCSFGAMDAVQLGFSDQTFDTVLCIEAAFHFDTRQRFLEEAYRILKAGGHLVMTDILFYRWAMRESPLVVMDNYLQDTEEYRKSLEEIGFRDIRIVDATDLSWRRGLMHGARWGITEFFKGGIGLRSLVRFLVIVLENLLAAKKYLLISAKKDEADSLA
jgi:cyclopropane fatty-acyl-phospholipid synthase-like methyltransferase